MQRLILLLLLALNTASAGEFFFRDGDVPAVFLGDSITEQRMYTTYIEAFVTSRFPKWKVGFRNTGWGGDTSWLSARQGFDVAFKRDIAALKPKVITIDYGMNDARGGDENLQRYIDAMTKLTQQLKVLGTRVALVTPSPEERFEAGQPAGSKYNVMLAKYSEALREIAKKEDVRFVDQYGPFVKLIEAGRLSGALGVSGDPRLIPDGVHPNWAGHLVMAHSILKELEAPALVSRAWINATESKVLEIDGCEIEILEASGDGLSFRRTDNCLPLYIPHEAEFALKIPGFAPQDDLSRYELKVTGLNADSYELQIDGKKAGTYSKAGLKAGVNLTLCTGPIAEQTKKLFDVIVAKNNLYFYAWRQVQILPLPTWLSGPEIEAKRQAEYDRAMKLVADKEAEIETLRQPLPHVFKLVPMK